MEAATPFPAAETRCAQKATGDCAHAYVDRGVLFVMADGTFQRMGQYAAWSEWMAAASSPIASTQERARQIRAALDEAYPERLVA